MWWRNDRTRTRPGGLRALPKSPAPARRRQPFVWKLQERRAQRWRALRLWSARAAVFGPVFLVVLFRLTEIATGYATPTTGCRITGVIDGDTVRLSCLDRDETRGRLLGFDTPEVFSPHCGAEWRLGMAATSRLRREIWSASRIETLARGTDRYGRLLVVLRLDGEDVATRMVAAGFARPYHGGTRKGWCS